MLRPFAAASQALGKGIGPSRTLPDLRVFAAFDSTSFFSLWYWVLTVVIWTQVCHRTLGVPYDMILRAERLPRIASEVDSIASIAASRLAAIHRLLGIWIAALAGFALAALGVLGLGNGVEPALAGFMLLMPLAIVGLQTWRLALHIDRTGARGAALRRELARRRAWNQTIAFAAITTAAIIALFYHPSAMLLRW
jgi:hypothetical protein